RGEQREVLRQRDEPRAAASRFADELVGAVEVRVEIVLRRHLDDRGEELHAPIICSPRLLDKLAQRALRAATLMLTADRVEEFLKGDGWPVDRVDQNTWRSGFRGDVNSFRFYV